MFSLKNAEVFTLRQRRKIVLPVYRRILKSCINFKAIDPLASVVLKAIIVMNFRKYSSESRISNILQQINQAHKFLNTLQAANSREDVIP